MNKIDDYFNRFIKLNKLDPNTKYLDAYHFELSEYWANELLRLVLIGQKKATSSSYDSFIISYERLPKVGDYYVLTDWEGNPKCVVKDINITIMPFKDITFELCSKEGEDDCLESWRKGHTRFFQEEGQQLGYKFSEDMLVVFEEFEVVYQEK